MKVRIFITLISFSFLSLLINGCGDDGGRSSHYSGSGDDMNFEQQALKMEQEDIAKLTEPFYRADKANNIKGFGIGLTIVKKVIESHKGELIIQSKYNKGSTFTLTIPFIESKDSIA